MKNAAPFLATLLSAASAWAAQAPLLRDPMQPPASSPQRHGGPAATEAPAPAPTVHQLLVVDGQRFVVHGGRRRAVGELLGDARIERIDDSAVIVRRAGQLQRLPLFAGVIKKPSAEPAAVGSAPPAAPDPARTALAPAQRPQPLQRAGNPP